MLFNTLISEIECCNLCGLSLFRKRVVTYSGSITPRIMILGSHPSKLDEKKGLPFQNPQNKYLLDLLKLNGITYEQYIVWNTVLCVTMQDKSPLNNSLLACSDWLYSLINILDLKYIITVGKEPSYHLIPDVKSLKLPMNKIVGKIYTPPQLKNIKVIPITAPALVFKNPHRKDDYSNLIANVANIVKE